MTVHRIVSPRFRRGLLYALLPLGTVLPPAPSPADWVALPMPSLCEPRMHGSHPGPLASGVHLLTRNEGLPLPGSQPTTRLPVSTLLKLLEDEARAKGARGQQSQQSQQSSGGSTGSGAPTGSGGSGGSGIEFFRSASGLLARGDPAAIETARARIAEIERAALALRIDLEIELAGSADGTNGGAAKPERFSAKPSVQSGEEAFCGLRQATPFVMSFDVEVAADSGIASPVLGTAAHGRTIHVRASRVEGGKRVHIEGLLDLADLAGMARFDPETPDLGTLQQPTVDAVQIAFAGVVDSGGTLEVEIAGAPLALPNWKLTVRASARPDDGAAGATPPASGSVVVEGAWDVIDLAFLASESTSLPNAGPGAELDRQAFFVQQKRATIPIPPSAIAAALDARAGDGGSPRNLAWTDDLLILPRSDARSRADARSLIAAAEKARLSTCRIEAKRGGMLARFPACSGSPARLLAGRERTVLVGYRAEIAPQTWMPAPAVERSFDGLSVVVEVQADAAECSTWIATSSGEEVVSRVDAQLGKLQVLSRGLRAERATLRAGDPERALATGQTGSTDAVLLRCLAP